MTIEVLYFGGCPNHAALLPRLRELVGSSGISSEIKMREITGEADAQRERFLGSPTVRVNGRDVEPGADQRSDFGIKCRLYQTATGISGQPQEDWLRAALNPTGAGL